MRILIFVKSMDGGTGTFVQNLLRLPQYYSADNLTIKIVALEKPAYRDTRNIKTAIYLRRSSFYPNKYFVNFKNTLSFISEVFFMKREIHKHKPSILLSIDIHCNLIALINKLFFYPSLKVVINNRINLKDTLRAKSSHFLYVLLKAAVKHIYGFADAIIAVSQGVRDDLYQTFKIRKNIHVIFNGISLDKDNKAPRVNKKNILLTIGRFDEQKDYETLIKSFAVVQKIVNNCKLIIVGNGQQKEHIHKIVSSLGLQKHIDIWDWTNNTQKYYNRADIFVFSSFREGFPNVLLEAMNNGLPIISTDTPYGPSEILEQNKYGTLVPVGDIKAMSHAIYQLFFDKKEYEYYSQQTTKRVKEFSLEKMLNSYFLLFKGLVKANQ